MDYPYSITMQTSKQNYLNTKKQIKCKRVQKAPIEMLNKTARASSVVKISIRKLFFRYVPIKLSVVII